MSKKIVAIGGGQIGESISKGIKLPYETGPMDREIIKLSNSNKPNVLFIGFADPIGSDKYFDDIDEIYGKRYHCNCKHLSYLDLINNSVVSEKIDWADIFYVGGGNTYTLMKIFTQYGLDEKLIESYNQGKVMSGLSAGGMCWFKYGNSVIPTEKEKLQLIKQKCLGLKNMVFAPHCDEINGHFENVQNLVMSENLVALSLSNCCAIEIVDDKYKIIQADSTNYKIYPFGLRSFWKDGKYHIENLDLVENNGDLNLLLEPKEINNTPIDENVKCLLKRRNIYFK